MGKTDLGKILQRLREKQNLSLEEAAVRAEISPFSLHQYENKGRIPRDEVKKRLGRLYGADLAGFPPY